jgi:hypothetical protein
MAKQKTYKVTRTIYGLYNRTTTVTLKGTVEELLETTKHAFITGRTWDNSINSTPKTIKGFASNYKKALAQALGRPVEVSYEEITE